MNINDAAKHLLNYFSPAEREIPDHADYPGRNAAVMTALNAGLQEMCGEGKPWIRKSEIGMRFHPPTAVTIDVSADDTAAEITSGREDWMTGCAIVIDGDDIDNQVRSNPSSDNVTLKFPYGGTTGTKTATVYCDALNLTEDVIEVLKPVRINGVPIVPMNSPSEGRNPVACEDYGLDRRPDAAVPDAERVGDSAGTPRYYHVGTFTEGDEQPALRITLYPAPSAAGVIDFQAHLTPPEINNLTSTSNLPVPFKHAHSVFLPIAAMALMQSPFFLGTAVPDALSKAYNTAIALIRDMSPNRTKRPRFVAKG